MHDRPIPGLADRIEALLPLVSKPSRYLGNEFHVIKKTPEPGMVNWCLCLPEVYEIGMSHWGLKILYEVLNKRPDALAERCYAPWFDMEAQLRKNGLPLFSLEHRRSLADFDFLGFSLQFELTYTNVLNCLDLAGIPLRAEDRDESHPLVIAGGPCVSNPEPLSDFMDMFLIGDAEEAIHVVTDAYKALRGRPRMEILREMSKVPGIYVPLMYESSYSPEGKFLGTKPRFEDVPKRVKRQFILELETAPYPETPLVPLQDIVQNRLTVEVVRGCTQGCRFCQAGYLYRPIRERSVEKILQIADEGIRKSGWDEVGLVSLSTADYTQLEPLADVMNARFGSDKVSISLPSLRADSFGVGVADKVKETKKTGFTFAPEAGSERLRLAMNKIIRDDEFFAAARIAYERGWRLIKMYFMVGLPTETVEDINGIVHFVSTIRDIGQSYGRSNSVNASVGAFVPKSHTPLQWDGFEDPLSLRKKIDYLRHSVSWPGSRLKWHHVEGSHLEAIMSLGDRRVGRVIETAFKRGARFDGWTEHLNYRLWMDSMAEHNLDPAWLTSKKEYDDALPWDHIDIGILKKWLVRERKKTDEQLFEVGKSLVADCRHGDCTACGIPGLPYDTKLTPKLEDEDFRRLIDKAKALSPQSDPDGITWPVRIRYRKTGPCRFISHLEMTGVLARAFRMARVPLAHSQGHSPHPKFAFGPSLPVGVEGLEEAFDAEMLAPWAPSFVAQLNAVLPEGLSIIDGTALVAIPGLRKKSLNQLAQRGLYRVDMNALVPQDRVRIGEIAARFMTLDTCVVDRTVWTPQAARQITDWESPSDPTSHAPAAAGASAESANTGDASSSTDATPPDPDADAPRPESRDDRRRKFRDRRRAKPVKREHQPPRPVDLKRAVARMEWRPESAEMELELHLDRADGQVANPRVILERLFLLGPEEQTRVRIRRIALLDDDGRPLRPAVRSAPPELRTPALT